MLSDPTEASDSIQISEGAVSITKIVEKKQKGMVVSYSLHADTSRPIAMRLRDQFPIPVDIEESGFHPQYEPKNWDVEEDKLIFEDVIKPGYGTDIIYGIVTSDDEKMTEYLSPPTIVSQQPMDSPHDAADAQDGEEIATPDAPLFRSSSLSGANGNSADEGSSLADEDTDEDTDGDDESTSTSQFETDAESRSPANGNGHTISYRSDDDVEADTPSSNGKTPPADASEDLAKETSVHGFGAHEPDERADQSGSLDGTITDESSSSTTQSSDEDEQPDSEGATVEATPRGSTAQDDTSSTADGGGASTVETDAQTAPPAVSSGDSSTSETPVLAALLAELQSMDASDEQVEALRADLGLDTTRALKLRLEHLETNVASVTPFADHVEAVIDEHGDLEETLTSIRDGVDTLQSKQADNRSQLEQGSDERDELGQRVGDLSERVTDVERTLEQRITAVNEQLDGLTDDIEAIEAALQSVKTDVTERTATVESRVDALDDQLDSLHDSVDSDLESLRKDLTELAEMRSALSEALLKTDPSTSPADDDGAQSDETAE